MTMTDTLTDWRYSDKKLKLRQECLKILLETYGNDKYVVNKSIYECAHDWVSQGNTISVGIINYYEENYAP